jgi:hypothetical protein
MNRSSGAYREFSEDLQHARSQLLAEDTSMNVIAITDLDDTPF